MASSPATAAAASAASASPLLHDWRPCASPQPYSPLPDGSFVFQVPALCCSRLPPLCPAAPLAPFLHLASRPPARGHSPTRPPVTNMPSPLPPGAQVRSRGEEVADSRAFVVDSTPPATALTGGSRVTGDRNTGKTLNHFVVHSTPPATKSRAETALASSDCCAQPHVLNARIGAGTAVNDHLAIFVGTGGGGGGPWGRGGRGESPSQPQRLEPCRKGRRIDGPLHPSTLNPQP